ncbi:MAG: phosphoadenylyl-sulfate reductase [Spirochaetota bacterium]
MSELGAYQDETRDFDAPRLLLWAATTFGAPGGEPAAEPCVTLASSLGAEDQVLTHMIASARLPVPVFTLDTGRMFAESYDLMERTRQELGVVIRPYFPDAEAVERMVVDEGPNLFYRSVELRKRCCHVRKVEPLRRALAGRRAWITGLRRAQSVTRAELRTVEWDDQNSLYKINPLVDWSEEDVWAYIRAHDVPYNALHDRGFPSIGCAPCTRAVAPGDDPRSGRWWWEQPEHRECGLHVADEGDRSAAKIRIAPVRTE